VAAAPRTGAGRSTAQSLVETRLVTVRTGFTPSGNSVATIAIPPALLSTILPLPPSHSNVLARVRWYGVLAVKAAGADTRVTPEGFSTAIRVVTSNVRQPSPSGF
jgi:hypothetical protein